MRHLILTTQVEKAKYRETLTLSKRLEFLEILSSVLPFLLSSDC